MQTVKKLSSQRSDKGSRIYRSKTNVFDSRKAKGTKYTRSRLPVTLVYYEAFETSVEAQKREYQIKKLNRQEKLKLIEKRTN